MKADLYAVSGTSPTSPQESDSTVSDSSVRSSVIAIFPQLPSVDSNFVFLGVDPSGAGTTFKTTSPIIASVRFVWIHVPEDGVA